MFYFVRSQRFLCVPSWIFRSCGLSGRVDGPEGSLSAIPDALSRSRGALSPDRAVAQRRSRASGLTRLSAEAIRGFGLGFVRFVFPRSTAVCRKSFVFSSITYKEGFGFASCRGPKVKIFSLFFSEARRDTICVVRVYFNFTPPLVSVPNLLNPAHGQAMLGS